MLRGPAGEDNALRRQEPDEGQDAEKTYGKRAVHFHLNQAFPDLSNNVKLWARNSWLHRENAPAGRLLYRLLSGQFCSELWAQEWIQDVSCCGELKTADWIYFPLVVMVSFQSERSFRVKASITHRTSLVMTGFHPLLITV